MLRWSSYCHLQEASLLFTTFSMSRNLPCFLAATMLCTHWLPLGLEAGKSEGGCETSRLNLVFVQAEPLLTT